VTMILEESGIEQKLSPVEPWADQVSHGLTVWFTGLSGAGKSTICQSVHEALLHCGYRAEVLDADLLRKQICPDLGFTKSDRDENVRRIGFLAHLLTRNGIVVLVAAISPYRAARNQVRLSIGRFLEVHVDAPLYVCEQRDPKGLYRRARRGEVQGFTGIDDPYEAPLTPDLRCATDRDSVTACRDQVITAVSRYLRHEAQRPLTV
jgi:adenylyl-sulfate kinase